MLRPQTYTQFCINSIKLPILWVNTCSLRDCRTSQIRTIWLGYPVYRLTIPIFQFTADNFPICDAKVSPSTQFPHSLPKSSHHSPQLPHHDLSSTRRPHAHSRRNQHNHSKVTVFPPTFSMNAINNPSQILQATSSKFRGALKPDFISYIVL